VITIIFKIYVMKSLFSCVLLTLLFVAVKNITYAQTKNTAWQKLKPYFNPPPKYAGEFGSYRTPLKFYDGKPVTTPADWRERRKEILDRWQKMMGCLWVPVSLLA